MRIRCGPMVSRGLGEEVADFAQMLAFWRG
jgi:hypothetical protein